MQQKRQQQQSEKKSENRGPFEPFEGSRDFFLGIKKRPDMNPRRKNGEVIHKGLRPVENFSIAGLTFQAHSSEPYVYEDDAYDENVLTKTPPRPGVVVPATFEQIQEVLERVGRHRVRWYGQIRGEVLDMSAVHYKRNRDGDAKKVQAFRHQDTPDLEPLAKYLVMVPHSEQVHRDQLEEMPSLLDLVPSTGDYVQDRDAIERELLAEV